MKCNLKIAPPPQLADVHDVLSSTLQDSDSLKSLETYVEFCCWVKRLYCVIKFDLHKIIFGLIVINTTFFFFLSH